MDLPASARCGQGTIDGSVWRPGDGNKHLGPPERLGIGLWSRLFATRCGLDAKAGAWRRQAGGEDDDVWCPDCLMQAGIAFELYED